MHASSHYEDPVYVARSRKLRVDSKAADAPAYRSASPPSLSLLVRDGLEQDDSSGTELKHPQTGQRRLLVPQPIITGWAATRPDQPSSAHQQPSDGHPAAIGPLWTIH